MDGVLNAATRGRKVTASMTLSNRLGVLLTCVGLSIPRPAAEEPALGPDSFPDPDAPKGALEQFVLQSEIFQGTAREYWVHTPAQYDDATPAAVMVFQDGHTFIKPDGDFRVPTVFDNLIHRGEMPVTIGVFVNPGHRGDEFPENRWRANNRSVEYDTLSDDYARFLLNELLPEIGKTRNLTADPKFRAICGNSSGGICAFTAAWERPDAFGKVVSHIGSFVNIRGGHAYPFLIRKAEPKPIRVFLQDGTNDLDNRHGHWPLGNRDMAAALKFKGYDHKIVWDDGAHNGKHGGAVFPDTLRWLWRDWKDS